MLVCKVTSKPEDIVEVSHDVLERMKIQSENISVDTIIFIIKELSELENTLKSTQNQRITFFSSLLATSLSFSP